MDYPSEPNLITPLKAETFPDAVREKDGKQKKRQEEFEA